jgi:K+-sensing histidine kinase KdpD
VEETATMLGLDPVTVHYEGFKAIENTWVSLSEHALEMICWELLENGKKFHPRQSPLIEVRVVNTFNRVSIQVMDDGATLSPDQLIKMWTPYYQIEKYFTGQIRGTGLGLSTVASLVWSVGGTCRAYNRLDGPGIVIELMVPQVDRYISKFFKSNEA